jgi:para-nitrobenzyl esterase
MTDAPTVTVSGGRLRGRDLVVAAAFLGIPYAAAPFGALRLRPPHPAPGWIGVRDATTYGPTAPKGDYPAAVRALFPEVNVPGEECLNLNVWTPDTAASGLPVLVWVHGGSFVNGSGSVAEYDGTAFARDGIVCVTINYRLGAEGFLLLDGDPDGTANLGLLDQIAALQWVQENIGAFGGDPQRVTIAGESAGAMSVATLLAMPLAEGLFAQAIAQSGTTTATLTAEDGRLVADRLTHELGVPAVHDAIVAVPRETLTRAAAALVEQVQTGEPDPAVWAGVADSRLPFAPVVDGAVLPTAPLEAIRVGQGAGVRLLIGSNRDEARLFLALQGALTTIDEDALERTIASYGLPPRAAAVYRAHRPGVSPGELLAAITTDRTYGIPVVRVAEARAVAPRSPTWVYRFDHPDPADNHGFGAGHAVEIPFVFDTIDRAETHPRIGDTPSRAAADAVHGAWVSFVAQASPGWAPYTPASRSIGLLSDRVVEVNDPSADERALWTGVR